MLQVTLFGNAVIRLSECPTPPCPSRQVISLLAYLVLFRDREHLREVLADTFWSDLTADQSRKCLNTALWRLRKFLETQEEPQNSYIQSTQEGCVGINCDYPHWFDVEEFERQCNQTLHIPLNKVGPEPIVSLENTLSLYKGELLEGFYYDWALRERERFRQLYVTGLGYLTQYFQSRCIFEKGIHYSQILLRMDPLREDIHRSLMRQYALTGQRSLVMRQYEQCQSLLAEELGIAPMAETTRLYYELLGETPAQESENRIELLHQAMKSLSNAQQQIQQALDQLEGNSHMS